MLLVELQNVVIYVLIERYRLQGHVMKRTRALEAWSRTGFPYELREFHATEFTAQEAVEQLGLPADHVFKTLLVKGEKKGYVLAVIPSNTSLNLKKLAEAIGDKRADMADLDDLTRLTGYLKGGVSPLGTKRNFPVVLDFSAYQQPHICLSAGQRGLQMIVHPMHLQQATKAIVAEISDEN